MMNRIRNSELLLSSKSLKNPFIRKKIEESITPADKTFLDQLLLDSRMNDLYNIPKATKDSPQEVYGQLIESECAPTIAYLDGEPVPQSCAVLRQMFYKMEYRWPKVFGNKRFYIYQLKQ